MLLTILIVTHIKFSFPKNTATFTARLNRVLKDIEVIIEFADFFNQACGNMDLDVDTAELGWKLKGQAKGDAPNLLSDADDFKIMMDVAIAKQQRAISNPVEVHIFNLVSAFLYQRVFEVLTYHLEATQCCSCSGEKAQGWRRHQRANGRVH